MNELYRCIKNVFNLSADTKLTEDMGPGDLLGWDSLGGINLINAIQEKFKIDFDLEEMARISSIGDIREIIKSKGKIVNYE